MEELTASAATIDELHLMFSHGMAWVGNNVHRRRLVAALVFGALSSDELSRASPASRFVFADGDSAIMSRVLFDFLLD